MHAFAPLLTFTLLASQTPTTASAEQPAGRRFVLEQPAKLHFEVPTNIGVIAGSLDVVRLDTRGIEGWGRFELRMEVDPRSVDTGDPLRDRHIAERMLGAEKGPIFLVSTDRVPSEKLSDGSWLLGASAWMDARRGNKHVMLRYRWEGKGDRGTLYLEHEATLEELGFQPVTHHPFVQVTGPVKLRLTAPLVRQR